MTATNGKSISLFPEVGVEWALWGATSPEASQAQHFPTPSDFGFSPVLTERLRKWINDWENFYDNHWESPTFYWKDGFDKNAWITEGLEISAAVEKETHLHVDRRFIRYLRHPLSLIKRPSDNTHA